MYLSDFKKPWFLLLKSTLFPIQKKKLNVIGTKASHQMLSIQSSSLGFIRENCFERHHGPNICLHSTLGIKLPLRITGEKGIRMDNKGKSHQDGYILSNKASNLREMLRLNFLVQIGLLAPTLVVLPSSATFEVTIFHSTCIVKHS